MMRLFNRGTRAAPRIGKVKTPGMGVVALSPTGEMLTLERGHNGRYKAQTAGAWAGNYGGRVREVNATDYGRGRAYSASVWAFSCVQIRAAKVADLMNATQLYNKASNTVATDHPYLDAIQQAYIRYKQDVYWEFMANRLIFGESYVEKIPLSLPYGNQRINLGPGGIRVLPSAAIEPRIELGRIVGYDLMDESSHIIYFEFDDIAYYKTFNPLDSQRGLSPMDVALDSVNVDMYIVRYSKQYYSNGARPGLVFTPKETDFNEMDMDNIRQAIRDQLKGVDNFFRPIFLTHAMDATLYPQQSLEDQSYLTAEQRERIAATFNVPVGMVTFSDQRYQFSPEHRQSFYEEVVVPDMNELIRFFNANVLSYFDPDHEYELRANVANVTALIGQMDKKADLANKLFDRGAISFNQRREMLNMLPVENGDFYSLPAGRVFVTPDQMDMLVGTMTQPNVLNSASQQPGQPSFYYGGGRDHAEPTPDTNAPENEYKAAPLTQQDWQDEVRAWKKKTKKGAQHGLKFECYYIPPPLERYIKAALDRGELDVFDRLDFALGKAIQATRLDFEDDFETLLNAGRAGDINRRQFSARLRTMIRKYGLMAYRDGLSDGGVEIDEGAKLEGEDQATYQTMVGDQGQFVTDFGETLFYGSGVTDAQVNMKVLQWWGKTIAPFYDAGHLSANQNAMMEFTGDDGLESCKDCQRLKGQRHRLKDWHRKGYAPPYGAGLDCADGGLCQHTLVRVDGRARGNW